MLRYLLFVLLFCFSPVELSSGATREYTLDFHDTVRQRHIPIALYEQNPRQGEAKAPVAIVNHGYDQNRGGSYKTYSYLCRALAENGFFVISIQHELPDDDLLAMEGELYRTRMPNWQKGMKNILYVMDEFPKVRPDLDWNNITLLGHSNGGDMCMLLATEHPGRIQRVVSLDHRRMPIPRTRTPKILSLRGNDYEADPGVIPNEKERIEHDIRIICFPDIKHGDMDDKGSDEHKNIIVEYVLKFLKGSKDT